MPRAGLRLLGGFELTDKEGATVAFTSRKGRALLAYLALNPDRHHGRGELAALLWGGRGEAQARGSLNQSLQALRKASGDRNGEIFATDRNGVTLHGEAIEVDVARLRRLATSEEAEDLASAARLYQGELLAGFTISEAAYEDWLQVERASVLKTAVKVFSRLAEQQLEAGDGEAAVASAEKLLALDPLGEPAHRLLMRAYGEAGRRSAALAQYQTLRQLLGQELGVEPEAETKALFDALKNRGGDDERLDETVPAAPTPKPERDDSGPEEYPIIPDKPSIAVLPFENMSGDPEQDYFADGIAEDIITDLSKVSALFVIARNSAFTYKGKAVEVRQIARELGVRYLLEGSVRKAGNRVRITAQLIDGMSSGHLWAERYDRDLTDIFVLQDEITEKIVAALQVKLTEGEQKQVARRYTENLEAYDHFLRGRDQVRATNVTNAQAREMFERAIELDPGFAAAYAILSYTHWRDWLNQWSEDPQALERAFEAAQKAVALDDSLPLARAYLAWAYVCKRHHEQAIVEARYAISLDPNFAEGYARLGDILTFASRPEEGLDLVKNAMRLDPHFPANYLISLGEAYYVMGKYEEAIAALKRSITRVPEFLTAHRTLAVIFIELDRKEEARTEVAKMLKISPRASLEGQKERILFKDQAVLERYLENLRKAGLP